MLPKLSRAEKIDMSIHDVLFRANKLFWTMFDLGLITRYPKAELRDKFVCEWWRW
jgi:hypothetical protein